MSALVAQHNIGSLVVPVTSVFPQNAAAGSINGASIDRVSHNMANSCVLHQVVGADSRETIIQALFSLALAAATFNTSGRRLLLWSKVASFPALFVQSTGTQYPSRDVRGLPPKRTITAELWVYTDAGKDPNANPEQALNDIIDAVEAALLPGVNSNAQTLGGIVSHAWIEGEIEQFPGVLDGIAKAIIPVKILVP